MEPDLIDTLLLKATGFALCVIGTIVLGILILPRLVMCDIPKLTLKIAQQSGDYPTFEMVDDRFRLDSFEIFQITKEGRKIGLMWKIEQSPAGATVYPTSIQYGKVPNGWIEVKPIAYLKRGCIYSVNDREVFLRKVDGRYVVPGLSPFKISLLKELP